MNTSHAHKLFIVFSIHIDISADVFVMIFLILVYSPQDISYDTTSRFWLQDINTQKVM
jgi:hypothetical protein